jgi:hypothetical protein
MSKSPITSDGAKRIQAAHEKYVEVLRHLNRLRCAAPSCGAPDHHARLDEARKQVDDARAEWIRIYQHETGRSLATAS